MFQPDRFLQWCHALPGAMLPTTKAVFESPKYWDHPRLIKYKEGITEIIKMLQNPGIWPHKINPHNSVVTDFGIFETMYQKVALGRLTAAQGAAEVQKEMEQKIKERTR